jgi:hypothetical protein
LNLPADRSSIRRTPFTTKLDVTGTTVRSRNRFLSALFGFLVPGLGHVYIGRARRFLLFASAYLAVVLALGLAGLLSTFVGMATYVVLLVSLYVFGIMDPPILVRPGTFEPKWYNHWYGYVGWAALALIFFSVVPLIRESVLGHSVFRVPGIAMVPAIQPRDIVLVDTRAFAANAPAAKEVVVVRGTKSGLLYVRRISAQTGPSTVSLIKDNPEPSSADLELSSVSTNEIVGKVTYVFFSWSADRIGRRVE